MESLSQREYNRALMQKIFGVDPDASFFERMRQGFRRQAPHLLNAFNAIGPGKAIPTGARIVSPTAHDLWVNNPIRPAANPQGEFANIAPNSGIGFVPRSFHLPGELPSALRNPTHNTYINRPGNENTPIPIETSGSYRPHGLSADEVSNITSGNLNDILRRNEELGRRRLSDFFAQERRSNFRSIPGDRKGGNNPPIDPQEVLNWLSQADIPVNKVHTSPRTGTTYIRMPQDNPTYRGRAPSVRIPSDSHIGNVRGPQDIGNMFDTGTTTLLNQPPRLSEYTTRNISGGSYSEPRNLFDALRWRFSRSPDGQFLIPPEQAPFGIRTVEPPAAQPRPDPNQLNLFSDDILKALSDGT